MSRTTDYDKRLAEEVFGSPEKAQRWLNSENLALGAAPVNHLSNETDTLEVKKILDAITRGGVI